MRSLSQLKIESVFGQILWLKKSLLCGTILVGLACVRPRDILFVWVGMGWVGELEAGGCCKGGFSFWKYKKTCFHHLQMKKNVVNDLFNHTLFLSK